MGFTRDFDAIFASEGLEIIKTPVRAPKANAFRAVQAAGPCRLLTNLGVERRHRLGGLIHEYNLAA